MRKGLSALAVLTVTLAVLPGCSRDDATTAPVEEPESPVRTATLEPSIDPATGFKMTGDWKLVRGHCTGCHSSKLITQQRGTPQQWLTMIRWMQANQNLWQFDPATESRFIAFLGDN